MVSRERHENAGQLADQFEDGPLFLHLERVDIVGMPAFERHVVRHQADNGEVVKSLASPDERLAIVPEFIGDAGQGGLDLLGVDRLQ